MIETLEICASQLGLPLAALFVNPIKLPGGARLWTFLPLALSVAVVYRATRARSAAELPGPTIKNFLNIALAMAGIAVGFYILHEIALRYF